MPRRCKFPWTGPLTIAAISSLAAHVLATAVPETVTVQAKCQVPDTYSKATLVALVEQNCNKVKGSVADFLIAKKDFQALGVIDSPVETWKTRGDLASQRCLDAENTLLSGQDLTDYQLAAYQAVNAWGSIMLEGRKCCTLTRAPYCIDTSWSASTIALAVPFAVLLLLFFVSVISSWILPQPKKEPEQMTPVDAIAMTPAVRADSRTPKSSRESSLKLELESKWMQEHCLRVLPGAASFAHTTSSLFAGLQEAFDFQPDNVRNQFDHLLSLWRSQCAMVADRSVEDGTAVNENLLLGEALGDLHVELLDGFLQWRVKLASYGKAGVRNRKANEAVPLGGAKWDEFRSSGSLAAEAATLSTQLAEMATYLLVWGEAGNVRFMPEAIYFITELALSADPADFEDLYTSSSMHSSPGAPFRSSQFLSKVIRPIYNMVFDEWYQYVDVDASNGKDKKKLHHGLDNFLPPDVANYDDWNEFFCDPERMVEGMLLQDGTSLFHLPQDRRFSALERVDWQVTLEAAQTKTHRELHSLWGVFATTHRIWLLHALLFLAGVVAVTGDPPAPSDGGTPLGGQSLAVRFAAVGLVVPMHALLWACARWQVTGRVLRLQAPLSCASRSLLKTLFWMLPLVTYAAIRDSALEEGAFLQLPLTPLLVLHFTLCFAGLFILLLVPSGSCGNLFSGSKDNFWTLTAVPCHMRLVRYFFWLVVFTLKFLLGLIIFKSLHTATVDLNMALPGRQSLSELSEIYYSTEWGSDILLWFVLWFTTFVLFVSDTQLWFTLVCSVLGVCTVFVQRGCHVFSWAWEDAVAKIPVRFSQKVLPYAYAPAAVDPSSASQVAPFSPWFPAIWDRVLEYMRYEDKIDNHLMGDLSFKSGDSGHNVHWEHLKQALGRGKEASAASAAGSAVAVRGPGDGSVAKARRRIKVPDIFREKTYCEMSFKTYSCMRDPHWPSNPDVQWRITALSRGLGLPMPRPFRAPYIPGITVCIPHYGESILMLKKELFQGREETVPLMDWLKSKYDEEFLTFANSMLVKYNGGSGWPAAGSQWEDYTEQQWDKISAWASMRMQTLWRTVAGMCLYHPALQLHWEAQADKTSKLAQPGIWDPSDCFTCLVSMQMYKFFDKTQLEHTNRMFKKFPDCLKVAFIDCEDKGITGESDSVHPKQKRRYFSSLIDAKSKELPTGMREAHYKVELPGYPILGDGKGDNQNHAIPFMRGVFTQCIDANQGAYFEQMMLLPCALGEFRSRKRGDGQSKRIVGFPEHITSDIGSIGDFAASAEVAFGTILQRTYSVLGARMHYGHPDIMNKLYMMQQGGVSKATKTVNLSEDIFAGMDFTLRGGERRIKHSEYFHLAKGRDLGFNTVLGFFSKLSSGTGEQVLTRQAFRLEQVLHLPEALTFYYAHVGYYFTQFFVSWSMPLLVFVWLLVLLTGEESSFTSYLNLNQLELSPSEVMAKTVGVWFSWLLLLFLIATSLPLLAEVWMERSFKVALERFLKQMFTLSPLMFIFQAKIIGHYVMNEIRYGGATYVSTGRGLPTDRRPFIGEAVAGAYKLKKVGGLFLDYAAIAYYDGVSLLSGVIMIVIAGGISKAGDYAGQLWWVFFCFAMTIASWLWGPFLFNPYQFVWKHFCEDFRCLVAFFLEDSGRHWVEWYDRTQLKPRSGRGGLHRSMVDITFVIAIFFLAAWYAMINTKIEAITLAYSGALRSNFLHAAMLVPPIMSSAVYCVFAVIFETVVGCSSILHRRLLQPKPMKRSKAKALAVTAPGPLDEEAPAPAPEADEVGARASTATDEDEDEMAPHARMEDREVEPAPAAPTPARTSTGLPGLDAAPPQCCKFGIPLTISACMVTMLDVCETVLFLYVFYTVGWRNAFIAGIVLKWALLHVVIFFGEGMLRASCCSFLGCCGLPLQLWVRAHRMARDIMVSSIIFGIMAPFVVLNSVNEYLCPGCNAHQLLIYRDPGHLARKEAEVFDIYDGEGWPGLDAEEGKASGVEGLSPVAPMAMPPPGPSFAMPASSKS
eukprot:TRINITY_DN22569_c0_g2_i1.p1 TRINITY_DN22569_c0_g2~~TRINITY_DN22569_c0_g2_i1.p1  ORF type:complete len:2009 (+),score=358.66 TRINITY_DN22569_c0_g2_i1:92-6118(+)